MEKCSGTTLLFDQKSNITPSQTSLPMLGVRLKTFLLRLDFDSRGWMGGMCGSWPLTSAAGENSDILQGKKERRKRNL